MKFVVKFGSGGRRHRRARSLAAHRAAHPRALPQHWASNPARNERVLAKYTAQPVPTPIAVALNELKRFNLGDRLKEQWDEETARLALSELANSGQSQRAFAETHGFPESRIRSWKKKLENQRSDQ